ncbi:anti-sigma regulatory factor [Desulfotomaculum sp. 1211_IL3151]|uniref:anti-sigma regulatory factor n=1 Tax=Desulfotomaculum sp. 1211_IL3151 TaxID=3084055 RepID=UPI002FDA50A1
MNEDTRGEVVINNESDIIVVRKKVREAATLLNFSLTDVTRIVTAASELARNVFLYAGSGVMKWQTLKSSNTVGIMLSFKDSGPGITDLELVMNDGYSTSRGLGLGLPGSRRLMDDMEITSQVGKGTTIVVKKWRRCY